jgi:osmotically-inducible protein OsmY
MATRRGQYKSAFIAQAMGIGGLKTLGLFAAIALMILGASWVTDKATTRNDASILSALASRISNDERFQNVQIEVAGSIVSLKGSVRLVQDRRDLVRTASHADHVRSVNDQVSVDAPWTPDRFLRKELYEKLNNEQINGIGLKVKRGIVTVRGEVQTQADREHVLRLMSSTEGVREVADRMTVRTRRQAAREHPPALSR